MTITLHQFPYGWERVVASAIIRKNLYMDVHDVTYMQGATEILMRKAAGDGVRTGIMDHWGEDEDSGSLVCEPYGDHDEEARRIAEYLDLELVLGETPEWNKSCRRYRFRIKPFESCSAVETLSELIECVNWELRERCKAQDRLKEVQGKIAQPSEK